MAQPGGRIASGAHPQNPHETCAEGVKQRVPTSLDYKAGTSLSVDGSDASCLGQVHDPAWCLRTTSPSRPMQEVA